MTLFAPGSAYQVPVYILGLGQVGRQLVQDLLQAAPTHAEQFNTIFQFRGLFDSNGAVIDDQFLDEDLVKSILQWKQEGKALKDHEKGISCTTDLLIGKIEKTAIVVDTSATEKTIPLLLSAIGSGAGVAIANKKPVTSTSDVFQKLNSPQGFIGIESTVGAGTPIIACLDRLLASGDQVIFIEGTLSGTLGFLATEWENGKPFSIAVEEAYNLGYTEPDPRDDLSGMDVARKALILARKCGATNLELDDILVEPLFHPNLQKLPIPDFLESLSGLDDSFNQKIAAATDNGCVMRYVARIELNYPKSGSKSRPNAKITVGLQEVPISSPLGQLSGTDNLVAFTTSTYDSSPLVIRGKGAGVKVTASGVIADMIQISKWRQSNCLYDRLQRS